MSVLAVASFFYLDWRFSEAEANAGLTKATADSFEAWLDKNEDGTWDVDEFLKMSVRKQKGWAQIINDNEKTDYAYRVPKDVPSHYSRKDLLSIYQYRNFDNYKLNYWTVTINDETYLILFGWKSASGGFSLTSNHRSHPSLPFLNIKKARLIILNGKKGRSTFSKTAADCSGISTARKKNGTPSMSLNC